MPTEGQTAIGPNGETAVFTGGQWVIQSAAPQVPGAIAIGPRDNSKSNAAANEAERIRLAQDAAARAAIAQQQSASAQQQSMAIAQQKAQREALEWQATHNPDGSPKLTTAQKPTLTAKERADALRGYTDADALEKVAADLERQFLAGPGATTGFAGLQDYLPTATNKTFDDTSFQARGRVKRALGFTGGEGNTVGEIGLNYGPFLPEASDRDTQIKAKIQALRELAADSRKTAVAVLGGVPDANGNVTPVQAAPNAMDQAFVQGGDPTRALAAGSDQAVQQLPEAMRQEYAAYVAQNAGRIDPQAYAAFRNQLNAKYGFAGDGTDYAKEAASLNEYYSKGGRTFGNIPNTPKKLSAIDAARNTLANNPATGFGAGLVDAGSMGVLSAVTGDKMDMLREARPYSTTAGEVAGALLATKGIGGIGASTLGKIGPLNNVGRFGRNLATDTAYGAGYGTVTQGDPVTGALTGAVGSTLGQGVGSAIGRAAGGLAETPAAQYLRSRGMQGMTVGQRLGGMAKNTEDRVMSWPIVGDLVRNRRVEGFRDFNRLAFDEAGAPVGATVSDTGEAGLGQLRDQIGNAYDQATAGVNVPLDAQFPQDLAAIGQQSRMLPTDLSPRFSAAMDNAVQPIYNAGQMTGDTYQQAVRSLKGYRAETTKPGFEADYRGLLSDVQGALTDQMRRGGGSQVVEGLGRADNAYRQSKTLERAIAAAKNGTGSGEGQIFTPAQLNTASFQTASKFPGARPFAQLAEAGQDVLPSTIPDSGTPGRLAQMALPTLLGGTAVANSTGYDNTATGLGLAALLAAGSTKNGQKLLGDLLFSRPKPLRDFGTLVRKNKGLFGSASIPLLLEAQQ